MSEAVSCRRGEALQGIVSLLWFAPLTLPVHRDLHDSSSGDLQSWSRVAPGCLQSVCQVRYNRST